MPPAPDERIEALQHARSLVRSFVGGDIDFAAFYSGLTRILGDSFDGIDSIVQDLPHPLQSEVRFYSRWTGGEWGEYEGTLPRRNDWVYGENSEPYGWIDVSEYRRAFALSYAQLALVDLNAIEEA